MYSCIYIACASAKGKTSLGKRSGQESWPQCARDIYFLISNHNLCWIFSSSTNETVSRLDGCETDAANVTKCYCSTDYCNSAVRLVYSVTWRTGGDGGEQIRMLVTVLLRQLILEGRLEQLFLADPECTNKKRRCIR